MAGDPYKPLTYPPPKEDDMLDDLRNYLGKPNKILVNPKVMKQIQEMLSKYEKPDDLPCHKDEDQDQLAEEYEQQHKKGK